MFCLLVSSLDSLGNYDTIPIIMGSKPTISGKELKMAGNILRIVGKRPKIVGIAPRIVGISPMKVGICEIPKVIALKSAPISRFSSKWSRDSSSIGAREFTGMFDGNSCAAERPSFSG